MATLDNGAILREAYRSWNSKDMERAASYAVPDAPMTNVPFGTKTTHREHIEGWAKAFPDGEIDVKNLVAQGDCVIAEFTGRGTNTGALSTPNGELPATGRRVEMQFVEVYRFRNGKIVEGRMYFDSATLMAQLGLGAAATTGATRDAPATAHRH